MEKNTRLRAVSVGVKLIVASITLLLLVSACSKSTPKCSDEETLSLVRKIIVDKMFDKIGRPEDATDKEITDNLKIEFPRASAYDGRELRNTHVKQSS
jgi:hypothetical protein